MVITIQKVAFENKEHITDGLRLSISRNVCSNVYVVKTVCRVQKKKKKKNRSFSLSQFLGYFTLISFFTLILCEMVNGRLLLRFTALLFFHYCSLFLSQDEIS